MSRKGVSVRELRAQLSAYLRQVEAGWSVTITKRGKPIGRIVPVAESTEARLEALEQAGLIAWDGNKLQPMEPVARAEGDWTVADLLLENRE